MLPYTPFFILCTLFVGTWNVELVIILVSATRRTTATTNQRPTTTLLLLRSHLHRRHNQLPSNQFNMVSSSIMDIYKSSTSPHPSDDSIAITTLKGRNLLSFIGDMTLYYELLLTHILLDHRYIIL